jgi:hypothetical protein
MTAWLLVGGFGGLATSYLTDPTTSRSAITCGIGGVALAVVAMLAIQVLAAPARIDADLRRQICEQEAEEVIDQWRNDLGKLLDRLVVDADKLYADIFSGKAGADPQGELMHWSYRVRCALVAYGIDFEWRAIDAISPLAFVVPREDPNKTELLLEALEARKQRLLVAYRRCSKGAADRLNPTKSPT